MGGVGNTTPPKEKRRIAQIWAIKKHFKRGLL